MRAAHKKIIPEGPGQKGAPGYPATSTTCVFTLSGESCTIQSIIGKINRRSIIELSIRNTSFEINWLDLAAQAVIEILGPQDFPGVSLETGPAVDLAGSHRALESAAGVLACRGLEDRIGQALFRGFLRRAAEPLGFFQPEVLYQPVHRKVITCLQLISAEYKQLTGTAIQVKEQANRVQLIVPALRGAQIPYQLPCPVWLGFLKEFMAWCGGGRNYLVEETGCRGAGNTGCTYTITLNPLD
jgi:hypothetical protein